MNKDVRVRVIVRGRVQGVSFRYFTRREASELGVSGWVRNRPDGTVELQAQGPKKTIDLLVEAVRTGPPTAKVEDAEIETIPTREGEIGFGIRY